MEFYYLPSNVNYFSCIAKYVLANYADKLDKIKIFFSHSLQCQFFQKELISTFKQQGSQTNFLLPQLIPINNLWEHFLVLKIHNKTYSCAKMIEEILCLTKHADPDLHIADSLEIAYQIYQVLKELADNQIDISQIEDLLVNDQSIHMQDQLKILASKDNFLRQALGQINKLTNHDFNAKIVTHYLSNFTKSSHHTIFIGLVRQSKTFESFLANNMNRNDFTFILPPIDSPKGVESFIDVKKLINSLKIKKLLPLPLDSDIKENGDFHFTDFLQSKMFKDKTRINNISLIEAENEIEESSVIFLLITQFLERNPQGSVMLMVNNRNIINFVINNLKKYGISISDLVGENFLDNKLIQFILCLTNYVLDPHNIDKLLTCLKHPFLFCINCSMIEQILREQAFIRDVSNLVPYIENHTNIELKSWWQDFYTKILDFNSKLNNNELDLHFLLQITLKLAEAVYPDVWRTQDCEKITHFFRELIKASENFGLIKTVQYYQFLKAILQKHKIISSNTKAQVTILPFDKPLHLNFDLVIIADMNGDVISNSNNHDMWIAKSLRNICGLSGGQEEFAYKMQDFYLLLCNKEVVLTRAKKIGNSCANRSKLLQQVIHLANKGILGNIEAKSGYLDLLRSLPSNPSFSKELLVNPSCFPDKVSATNIELLIKNPHGFYAKNILKLYKYNELNKQELNAEFGTLLHQVICNFNFSASYTLENFLNIARMELENIEANEFITNLWWPKIVSIGKEYVNFALQRKYQIKKLYSEIYGEIYIDCGQKKQKIIAIADEIILTNDDRAIILDYKTGSIPSKKDVLCGLAPQLIIEGLILKQGGFKDIPPITPSKITFIKISTLSPCIQEVSINDIDFDLHHTGLLELLNYYLTQDKCYQVLPNQDYMPKYDQYRHLGRANYFLYI